MKNVIIVEKFDIGWGKTILVKSDDTIYVGDEVQGDDGIVYKVKGINMPKVPQSDTKSDLFGIIYE